MKVSVVVVFACLRMKSPRVSENLGLKKILFVVVAVVETIDR